MRSPLRGIDTEFHTEYLLRKSLKIVETMRPVISFLCGIQFLDHCAQVQYFRKSINNLFYIFSIEKSFSLTIAKISSYLKYIFSLFTIVYFPLKFTFSFKCANVLSFPYHFFTNIHKQSCFRFM